MLKKCPKCGSTRIAPILYGMPAFDEELQRKLDNEKIYLGGCLIEEMQPEYHCFGCRKDIASPPIFLNREHKLEDYRDAVTEIRFRDGGYFQGFYDVRIRKKDGKITLDAKPNHHNGGHPVHREMKPAEWKKMLDRLYGKLYLHEWKKNFEDWTIMDGEQWSLVVHLTNGRVRTYKGSNNFPPYWDELLAVFKPFLDEMETPCG